MASKEFMKALQREKPLICLPAEAPAAWQLSFRYAAWLFFVIHCKTTPLLYRLQKPAHSLKFEEKSKGLQYFLPMHA